MLGIRVKGGHLGRVTLASACALVLAVPLAAARVEPREAAGALDDTTWNATAVAYRGQNGARFVYSCPSYGTAHAVWGTDVYTDDSSVCTAGVHSGQIAIARGGTVTIEMRAGQSSYRGSTRNGIASRDYGSWGGSFAVVGAPGGPPDGTATGTVLVNGKPFTGGPVPYGATVDVSKGKLTLRTDVGTMLLEGDGKSPARFVPRRVSERVKGRMRQVVELKLVGGDFGPCAVRRTSASGATPAPKPKVVRGLWGRGKGSFRTRGRYASATVRGTRWLTTDRCDGTLTRVLQGVVEVRDLTRKRTVRVRAGKSYLAPARR